MTHRQKNHALPVTRSEFEAIGWQNNADNNPHREYLGQYIVEAVFDGDTFKRFMIYSGRKPILILHRAQSLSDPGMWLWLTFGKGLRVDRHSELQEI